MTACIFFLLNIISSELLRNLKCQTMSWTLSLKTKYFKHNLIGIITTFTVSIIAPVCFNICPLIPNLNYLREYHELQLSKERYYGIKHLESIRFQSIHSKLQINKRFMEINKCWVEETQTCLLKNYVLWCWFLIPDECSPAFVFFFCFFEVCFLYFRSV